MKVLLVNGSPHEKGCTYTALAEIASALNKEGIETEIFHIGTAPVRGCIACGGCKAPFPTLTDAQKAYIEKVVAENM